MEKSSKATRIDLFSLASPQMRAFHMTWLAFFSVFFSWFAIAPLMPVVRADLGLNPQQIANTVIASVAGTVFMRVLIGPLCERWGARLTYSVLLVVGSLPVMGIGLAHSYRAFLLFRLAVGMIGAAFVITQYHTMAMFAPNCVGTATATTAGWGNLGGGVTQMVMPLLLAGLVASFGLTQSQGWRAAMVVPGAVMMLMGVAYFFFTQDAPDGNYRDLRRAGVLPPPSRGGGVGRLLRAVRDPRVLALFAIYAVCFGVELTIDNLAALYFHDRFTLTVARAGLIAGSFGSMSIFARTLGGWLSDRSSRRWGLSGRTWLLFGLVLGEGLALMLFSRMSVLPFAVAGLLFFSLFVKMSEGATYGLVPFVSGGGVGSVAGVVGAGGNAGAVLVGLMFKIPGLPMQQVFLYLGGIITCISVVALVVRFPAAERVERGSSEVVGAAEPVPTAEELARVG